MTGGRIARRLHVDRTQDAEPAPVDVRRIARLFRPYRRTLLVVFALLVGSAVLGIVPALVLRDIIDEALPHHDTARLTWLVAGLVAAALVLGLLNVMETHLSHRVGQSVMHDLRSQVYTHLRSLSLAWFTKAHTGEVQSRIANDIGGVQAVVTSTATSILANGATATAALIAMFLLDWRLALLSVVLLPVFLVVVRRVGRERRAVTTLRQRKLDEMTTLVEESLSVSGVLLGRTMGRDRSLIARFSGQSGELADLEVRQRTAGQWVIAALQIGFAITPALVYWIAGQSSDAISIGTLVAFTTIQARAYSPVVQLLSTALTLHSTLALFERIFAYLDEPAEVRGDPDGVALDPARTRGEVEFADVSFRYGPDRPWTLAGVELRITPGRVALVGETGSGKTTLGYLLAGLYRPERGDILIDGVSIHRLTPSSLAGAAGFVSQETHLFHASVRDNLLFAQPQATDEELHAATRAAQIHDLLAGLPHGYDTLVGERGYRFSGGEQQRLAIARAILRDPAVLVLDEATSALDAHTEIAVRSALDRLRVGRMTLVISHRLSAIRDADEILVLERGRIVERGTHDDLVAESGRYARLVSADRGALAGEQFA